MRAQQQAHPHQSCRDRDCERPYCRIWREARDEGYTEGNGDGYREGRDQGWGDGYVDGFAAGAAAGDG